MRNFPLCRYLFMLALTFTNTAFLFGGLSCVQAQDTQPDEDENDDNTTLTLAPPVVAKAADRNWAANRAAVTRMKMRVRVVEPVPEHEEVLIHWRHGGEGLDGPRRGGRFVTQAGKPEVKVGEWTEWLPLTEVLPRARRWEFLTITANPFSIFRGNHRYWELTSSTFEVQFAEDDRTFHTIREPSPRNGTISLAFPAFLLTGKGAESPYFTEFLTGLSGYARRRYERLAQEYSLEDPLPKKFNILGEFSGYGEATGFGVRHSNPEILRDELRSLRILGFNGLRQHGSSQAVLSKEELQALEKAFWGPPGGGTPLAALRGDGETDPFHPGLREDMQSRITASIAMFKEVGAEESWAQWWDEIRIAARQYTLESPHFQQGFREYLQQQKIQPQELGAKSWAEVKPYPLWDAKGSRWVAVGRPPEPKTLEEARLYYHSYCFLTYATAQIFSKQVQPGAVEQFQKEGIRLYSMQKPTPSWSGDELDWHEFYDVGANSALVFETSNRDARVWQWESYLSDIMRGISQRHDDLPIGVVLKPQRGAAFQRALSLVSRGATHILWYSYGPDYAKGDSYSGKYELLQEVAETNRFLAKAEDYIYDAQWVQKPQVAFVWPRSSEIWGETNESGRNAFENA